MITNKRQYKITKKELEKFQEAIEQVRVEGPLVGVDTIVHEAMIFQAWRARPMNCKSHRSKSKGHTR